MAIFDAPLTSYSGGKQSYSVLPAATQSLQQIISQARSPTFANSAGPITNVTANNGIWQGFASTTPNVPSFGGPTTQQTAVFTGYSPTGINAAASAQANALNQMESAINTYANSGLHLNLSPYTSNVNVPAYYNQARGAISGSQTTINDLINQYAKNPSIFGTTAAEQAKQQADLQAAIAAIPKEVNGASVQSIADAYGAARQRFNPYADLGANSANQLALLSGSQGAAAQDQATQAILNSPEVQNQLNLGTTAIGKLASAKGLLRSGNAARELQDFGVNLALNSLAQKRDSLLAQANLGSNAAQQIAGLYGSEQQAQIARDEQLRQAQLTREGQVRSDQLTRENAIRQAQIQQNADLRSAQLQAAGLSAQQANAMAQTYAQEQAAATDASRYAFETNAAVQRANTQDTVRANQDYLNYILGVYNARGQAIANQQLGLNSILTKQVL